MGRSSCRAAPATVGGTPPGRSLGRAGPPNLFPRNHELLEEPEGLVSVRKFGHETEHSEHTFEGQRCAGLHSARWMTGGPRATPPRSR